MQPSDRHGRATLPRLTTTRRPNLQRPRASSAGATTAFWDPATGASSDANSPVGGMKPLVWVQPSPLRSVELAHNRAFAGPLRSSGSIASADVNQSRGSLRLGSPQMAQSNF